MQTLPINGAMFCRHFCSICDLFREVLELRMGNTRLDNVSYVKFITFFDLFFLLNHINQIHTTKHKTYEIIHFIKRKYVLSLYAKLQGSTPQSFFLSNFFIKGTRFLHFFCKTSQGLRVDSKKTPQQAKG